MSTITLQKNSLYLTKDDKLAYCMGINDRNSYAICLVVEESANVSGMLVCMYRYYALDGTYPSYKGLDIIKKIDRFSKYYKEHQSIIRKFLHYIDVEKETLKEFSIFFIR